MPHDKAGRTYLSEFTASAASLSVGTIHRAKSNEHLSRNWKSKQSKLSPANYFQSYLPKAKSTQDLRKDDRRLAKFTASQASAAEDTDLALRLEFERELEEHLQTLLRRERYNAVTVPSSVKFSVTGEAPNRQPQLAFAVTSNCTAAMSRPRSPKGKDHHHLEGLDQLLHNIRHQLNQLSEERLQMEQRMDDVVNGIQKAQTQYQNQLRNFYQQNGKRSKHSPPTPGSLRRVHSSGEKYTNSTTWLIPRTSEASLDLPDGDSLSNQKERSKLNFNESASQCNEEVSVKESTADSAYGGSCSTYRGRRSESFSSTDSQSQSSSLNFGGSLSQSNEVFGNWMSQSTIPELPESPRLMIATPPSSLSQDSFMQSMPSLNHRSHSRHAHLVSPGYRPHRSYSTSTPKRNYVNVSVKVTSSPEQSPLDTSLKATSSPDVYRRSVKSDLHQSHNNHHHHHPVSAHRSVSRTLHRNSTDNVMNSVIAEDKADVQSFASDSLSQLSTCTDDGSPKAVGSMVIIRRSSLTGQLEHVRKPRSVAAVKRNSSFDVSKEYSTTNVDLVRQRASSVCGMNKHTVTDDFKVLNRGFRKRRRKQVILNTSVETTV